MKSMRRASLPFAEVSNNADSPSVMLQQIMQVAERTPNQVALRGVDVSSNAANGNAVNGVEKTLTFKELKEAINTFSLILKTRKVKRLALIADNSFDWVIIDLACIDAGVGLLPIPLYFTEAQRDHAISNSGVDACVSLNSEQGIEKAQWTSYIVSPEATDICYDKITYTSGSTGTPKGVRLEQALIDDVVTSLSTVVDGVTSDLPRHLCTLPLATLLENIAGVYVPLTKGGEVILLPCSQLGFEGSSRINPEIWAYQLAKWQPKSIILTPELLKLLVYVKEKFGVRLDSLEFVAVGGAKVSDALLSQASDAGIPVFQGYGLSEVASVVALNANTDRSSKPSSVGKPLPHLTVQIADDGEILVSPKSSPDKIIHTGDLGRIDDDGCLYVNGRKKNLLISSFGRNVSPEWIESQVLASPFVHQCLVVGDGQPMLMALIVPTPLLESAQSARAIEQHLKAMNVGLPDYAQVKHWLLLSKPFSAESGTLTPNGRPRRQQIIQHYQNEIQNKYQEISIMQADQSIEPKGAKPSNTQIPFFKQLCVGTEQARQRLLSNPMFAAAEQGNITKEDYVAFLEQAYHHVKHTVPLLMTCGGRLSDSYEWLREAVAEYIDEEKGHQEWILNDIAACGGDKERVRVDDPWPSTELMVAYAYDSIQRKNPLAFFGMVHVLEGTSVSVATALANKIQTTLDLPNQAFSYLFSHGSLDLEHVDFFEQLMNKVTDEQDQKAIIHAANQFYELYGNIFRQLADAKQQRETSTKETPVVKSARTDDQAEGVEHVV
ncbi:AMP-binding protein [Litoribrevibacter albus]|uniref:AMP-dependent synthetase/ligase domain-containing protein n=1 Tax=Litoribrevibacter albus TaxID=1473156 RepID=A0AA37SAL3_9GAMM|nr:hypothetical protein GCM10007876_16230 [Litoribrevibacter albus]